jgi:putative endopeptidase
MKTRWLSAAACAALMLAASSASAADDAPVNLNSPRYGTWGVDLTGRNTAVKPGDDFYQYGNGLYLNQLTIPQDRSRYGNFDRLSELSQERVRAILDETAAKAPVAPSSEADKTGAYYKAFMDEARVDQLGAKPLAPDLAKLRKTASREDLAALMGTAPLGFENSIFAVYIDADQKDPDHYAVYLSQAGLGMPDRDYYLTPQFATQKAGYQAYVERLLTLIGWDDPKGEAARLVAFETRIAEASWTRAERRDAEKTYNPTTVAELEKASPGFAWRRFLDASELKGIDKLVVGENTAFPKIAAIYAETPLSTLKTWAAFSLADNAAPYLSKPFVQARFSFRNKTLSGQPELQARWKRAVNTVQGGMGEAVGRVYVARWFTPEAKAKMDTLVGELKVALRGRLERLTWMGADTKAQALAKLDKFTVKIGYPSKWRDYSALRIRADDLYGDVERSTAFEWRRQVKRLQEPVDRSEWGMTPQTVNAYYNPAMNEIVFPAAILQAPFFDPGADPAVNYGGIGGVIGHEMTHGFDDQGRKYDGTGKLADWWTADDAKKFEAQAARLGSQYSAFEPLPGAKVNGELTMGENIADLGGLLLALDAYHLSLKGQPAPVIDGVTGDQRVFFGWAQVWRQKQRDDALRQQTVTDPHSPAQYRVNGVVRNIDAWYQAFGVAPTDKLFVAPEQRVRIW